MRFGRTEETKERARLKRKENMKRRACVEAEMRGVTVCAASQAKGAGSEGKMSGQIASHKLLQKKQFINEKRQTLVNNDVISTWSRHHIIQ